MVEQNYRRKIVLSEEDIAPILELLQADDSFKVFKKGAIINEFLIAVQRNIREYALRQRQEQQAFTAPLPPLSPDGQQPQMPLPQQLPPQPDYQEVSSNAQDYYNQQLQAKQQQWARARQQAQAQVPQPQYQPPQQPQYQPPQQPQLQPEPIRASEPAKPAEEEDDDVDFADFDDEDF